MTLFLDLLQVIEIAAMALCFKPTLIAKLAGE